VGEFHDAAGTLHEKFEDEAVRLVTLGTLRKAPTMRRLAPELIHHADRSSQ
jgi:hypothetical protein